MPKNQSPTKQNEIIADSGWKYSDNSTSTEVEELSVSWEALEFIYHEKNQAWYIQFFISSAIVSIIIFLLTGRDAVSAGIVLLVAVVFASLAARKPRQMDYLINSSGIHIGEKLYQFSNYRSFAILMENGVTCIWLLPMKRFMPILPLYFDQKNEVEISKALSNILPLENYEPDFVNMLMHKIRF